MVESLHPIDFATKVFGSTKYKTSDHEISNLAKNIALLRERGLEKLNCRLMAGGRKVWDTFSEHNFAVKLCTHHAERSVIEYEPADLDRPPDFKVFIEGITYWIQIKRLSDLERENRQGKIVEDVRRACKDIKIKMFFDLDLSEDFKEEDTPELIKFFVREAPKAEANVELFFPDLRNKKAIVKFWPPSKDTLEHISLGSFGDMDIVETTGLDKSQISRSLCNAAGAFTWNIDQFTLNFIAVDVRQKIDIDVCDAVFGSEFDYSQGTGSLRWSRSRDGFFHQNDFAAKVAGVIAMRRTVDEPVSDFNSMLLVNENYRDRLEVMKRLIPFENIIYYNMRPPMGQGNFRAEDLGEA